jgi:YidC/Oxa1 family membrane protein insertase
MEERRLLLAIALSLLVLTGYQLLFPSRPSPKPSPAPTAAVGGAAAASPGAPAAPARASAAPQAAAPALTTEPLVTVADDRERRVEVQGPDMTLAFTNRGARLLSWRLAHFTDERGRPEEMVEALPGGLKPLDIETGDPVTDARLREALFQPSAETLVLPASGETVLKFSFAEADLAAEKVLRFQPKGYLIAASAAVTRAGKPLALQLLWGPGVSNPTAREMEVQGYQAPHAAILTPGASVERLPAEKIGAVRAIEGAQWVGVESRYFVALLVPPAGDAEVRALSLPSGDDGKPRMAPVAAVRLPEASAQALVYVGPKDHGTLQKLGHGLEKVVPVGDWIGPIVVPFMGLLKWVHGHVGNYGWSIVALTVLINVLMGPLRHYSIANGIKMAKLAPEMRVIQERYRKVPALDPKRQDMQNEVAALYARHGMSMGTQMLVGCLPILLTMPFLIAFYRVLQVSVDLRGASFLWIPDLSQKDPLFLTPLVLGASMFLMQRITPTAMDPAQQRVMMIMPLMLVAMFFAAPAGLNVYWLSSNLCSIVQQLLTLRILKAGDAERKEKRRT